GEQLARSDDVGWARVASQGDDGRVLDEEEDVGDASLLAELHQGLLQAQRGGEIATAEIEDGDHGCKVSRIQGFKVSRVNQGCPHIRQRKASPPGTRQRLSDGYGPTDGPAVADAGPLRLRALGGCGPPASRLDSTFVL